MESEGGNVACQSQEQIMQEVVSDQQVAEKSESESPAHVDGELSDSSASLAANGVAAAAAAAAIAAKLGDLDSSASDSIEDLTEALPDSPKDGIDKLLMKQRRDLMNELRTIQNSHRPVSKGDQRRRLDRFLRQHLHGDVSDTTSEGSNDDDPPRRRRNGVVVSELEGLSRQQSVTQRLQCNRFRRDLENMVRGALIRQEREIEAALRLRTAGLPGNRPHPLSAEGGVHETGSHVSGVSSHSSHSSHTGGIPVPPPPPPAPGQYHHIPPPPPVPGQYHHLPPPPPAWQAPARQPIPQYQPQYPPQPQPQAQQAGNNHWPLPSAPWLVQNSVANGQGQANANRADIVQQAQREAIVSEISDLVHRQVVQQSLESQFRNQLEYLMMNRLNATEADGEAVMNYIHSIPQTHRHRRNDFSHLGIHINQGHLDAAGGAMGGGAVPAAFAHEMESLRSRMDELHEMVRMSMEMQLDLQRAIRQEVSAALHHQNGTGPPVSASSPATHPAAEGNCIICLDKEVDAVLYQCGHMCVCLTCGLRLSTMGSHCPMCRAPIRDVIRAYRCQRN